MDPVLPVDIIVQCTNTINKVMIALDIGNGDLFASCFARDGLITIYINGTRKSGRFEISQLAKSLHEKFKDCKHWEGNISLWPAKDFESTKQVRNLSYWKAMQGGDCISTGIHDDILEQFEGQWMIKARTIYHTWTKAGGPIELPNFWDQL